MDANARWLNETKRTIRLEREGQVLFVPDDMQNADRRWIEDAGLSIADYQPPAAPVSSSVDLWRVRAVLAERGLLDKSSTAIADSGDHALQAAWEYGNTVSRSSPLLRKIGLSDAEAGELFQAAAALPI